MTLPDDFVFSQGSFQDYVDCMRRFELRYLMRLAWPAVEAEPVLENERYLQRGERFHHMVHQHLVGIPAERLQATVSGEGSLEEWWRKFLNSLDQLLRFEQAPQLYPEISLLAEISRYNLVAKCDLVAVHADGQAVIFDWKTSRRRPQRSRLAQRMQTRVYPYLLARAGAHLNGGQPIPPENISMVYWFADFPEQPERFEYSVEQYAADEALLKGLIEEIREMEGDDFPLTQDEKKSRYCVYRSLCNRGVAAGSLEEADARLDEEGDAGEVFSMDLDFDEITEIAF